MAAGATVNPVINVAAICGSLRKASYHRGLLRAAMEISKESMSGIKIEYIDISALPMLNTDLEGADGSFPPAVEAFRRTIREADSFLFASPEYNYSVTAIEVSKESVTGIEIEHIDISSLPILNTDLIENGNYPPVVETFRQQILKSDSFLFASPEYNYSISAPLKNALDWASLAPNCWGDKAAAVVSAGGGFGGGRSQYPLRQIGVFLDLHFINKPEFFLNVFQPPSKFDNDGNLIDDETKEKLKGVLVALRDFTLRLKN